METFTKARAFVEHRGYPNARQKSIAELDFASIDDPITDIVKGFSALPHCFTFQCCYGHFLWAPEQGPHNLEPVPPGFSGSAKYRIAYFAFCIENSRRGRTLWQSLSGLAAIDPGYVQFGSADWFWERCVNSYALQVMPAVHALKDEALLEAHEAQHTQGVRDLFFGKLRALLVVESSEHAAG